MALTQQSLKNEYLRYDHLGRGETLWDAPVRPEPFFIPFIFHGASISPDKPQDSGRILSPFSLLKRRLSEPKSRNPHEENIREALQEAFALVAGEPAPEELWDTREDLSEIHLHFPKNAKLEEKYFPYLISSMGHLDHAVTLELVCDDQTIRVQFIAETKDAKALQSAFVASFPEVGTELIPIEGFGSTFQKYEEASFATCELLLHQETVFPVRGYGEFNVDPYQTLFLALAGARHEELSCIQITFEPCLAPWGENLVGLASYGAGGSSFFAGGELLQKAALETGSLPLFAVQIRLAALSENRDRAIHLVQDLANSFETFDRENQFTFSEDSISESLESRLLFYGRKSLRSGMILTENELLSLVHLPGPGVIIPQFIREHRATSPAPNALQSERGIYVGENLHRGTASPVYLSPTDRLAHTHVLGGSGSGKSTHLANSILGDIDAGHGCAVLDPHGDLIDEVLSRIPKDRLEDVVLIDPSDEEFPVAFNIFTARSETEKNLLASDITSIFKRFSSAWGDTMQAVLGNSVLAILESSQGGTLLDLRRLLVEPDFRRQFIESVEDPEVRYFWTREFPLIKGNTTASLLTRLNAFLRPRLIRNMVAQQDDQLDWRGFLDSGKIVLIRLSQGLIGEENSWLLGSLLVSRIYQTALTRQDADQSERPPFFLYIDECHNFVAPSLEGILSGARKYGLGLILAHQNMEQLRSRDSTIAESVLANCRNRFYFRLGDTDAKHIALGLEGFEADDLRGLSVGQAIVRTGNPPVSFNLVCPPLSENENNENGELARDISRGTYATPASIVKKLLDEIYSTAAPAKKASKKTAEPKTPKPPQSEASPKPHLEKKAPKTTSAEKSPPKPPPQKAESEGAGGIVHRGLQEKIKHLGHSYGFKAEVEATPLNLRGQVDVLLSRDGEQIACEIAVKSPVSQEVKNIRKCVEAGIPQILVISHENTHLEAIKSAAVKEGVELKTVSFLPESQVTSHFASMPIQTDKTRVYKGWKIRSKMKKPIDLSENSIRGSMLQNETPDSKNPKE